MNTDQGPAFQEPWQAQAFALVLTLHEQGIFTWKEWTTRLAAEIAAGKARFGPDDGSRYYEYWLAALEKLIADKKLVTVPEMKTRKEEWDRAARSTPHGKPIELARGRSST